MIRCATGDAAAAAGDGEVVRIEQPGASATVAGAGVNAAGDVEQRARGLDLAAVAALRATARHDAAAQAGARRAVADVRPQHDRAAATALLGGCIDQRVFAQRDDQGLWQLACALPATSDPDRTAATLTRGVDGGGVEQVDGFAEQGELAALATPTAHADVGGAQQRELPGPR